MMNSTFKSLTAIFLATTALTGVLGCENARDVERKPDVVEPIVKESVLKCDFQGSSTDYTHRLRTVLMDSRTKDLELLSSKNVTICLDGRLGAQTNDFADQMIMGVLYNKGTSHPTVSLFDNGKVGSAGSFWKSDTDDFGSMLIGALAEKISDTKGAANGEIDYAGIYSSYCGNGCMSFYAEWSTAEKFDQAGVNKNPQLTAPPLKSIRGTSGPNISS